MRTRQILEQKTAVQAGPGRGTPGGHRYWCVLCGGFKTHLAELGQDRKLTMRCRACGRATVLVMRGGVWMREDIARAIRDYLGWRTERVVFRYLEAREFPIPEPESASGRLGLIRGRFPSVASMTHREVAGIVLGGHDDPDGEEAGEAGRESDMATSGPQSKAETIPSPAAAKHVPPGAKASRRHWSRRTKAKAAGWIVSVPFLAMGALYALAWQGFYVWSIYYAIQPYYRPWMNEWWFAALSLIVPAAVAAAYRLRFPPLPEMPQATALDRNQARIEKLQAQVDRLSRAVRAANAVADDDEGRS